MGEQSQGDLPYSFTDLCTLLPRNTENVLDAEGSSPLHLAVLNDNPQCVKLLLNHRADISISKCYPIFQTDSYCFCLSLVCAENGEGQTALDIAVERKYDECIELVSNLCILAVSLFHCPMS